MGSKKKSPISVQKKKMTPQELVVEDLKGIASTIILDGKVSDDEIQMLINWLLDNKDWLDDPPLHDLKNLVSDILLDGRVTDDERESLFRFLESFQMPEVSVRPSEVVFTTNPTITFQGKVFQFTGTMMWGSRAKAIEAVEQRGGSNSTSSRFSPSTDYLVVGNVGIQKGQPPSSDEKVKAALELKRAGQSEVKIIQESDFVSALIATPPPLP